ncbi:MAG: hypothetical protein HGB17_07900 [Syntrophobacteraceae bacterium]|nr:hypothetical protein [Syntrophobacteraceae bacterium]
MRTIICLIRIAQESVTQVEYAVRMPAHQPVKSLPLSREELLDISDIQVVCRALRSENHGPPAPDTRLDKVSTRNVPSGWKNL